jgi:ParB family chromosome partitioning protein
MSKSKLEAALKKNGGVQNYVVTDMYENMSDEELKKAAFESRRNQALDIGNQMANDNKRNTLLRKAGFDWFDIDDLTPHPDNAYSIDEESIKNLAGLIYKSKEIQPLVLRETAEGTQILDGERRWRACKYLTEKYGDAWRMVPAHCHALGTLSDEDALFILHSNNMGQRILTQSERVMGFKVLADALVEWRKNDPTLKGVKTKTYLAEHFGVSERTAASNLAIAKGLSKEGMDLLDEGKLTREQAENVSRLTEEEQDKIVEIVSEGDITSKETTDLISTVKSGDVPLTQLTKPTDFTKVELNQKKEKSINEYLKNAKNSLKKARNCDEVPDPMVVAELKRYIIEIDQKVNDQIHF